MLVDICTLWPRDIFPKKYAPHPSLQKNRSTSVPDTRFSSSREAK
jgi:hypothetical protein